MRATDRGFVLPYVMLFSVVLVAIAMVVLSGAQNAAIGARGIEQKTSTLDAAEAGLNAALEGLDATQTISTSGQGTMADGSTYDYRVIGNFGGSITKIITDPLDSIGKLRIPSDSALIVSTGVGPRGERPTTVEAIVASHVVHVNFQKYAIIAGRNIQGTYQGSITDVGNGNNALIQANGSINASVIGGLSGQAAAAGDTNTLPPGRTDAKPVDLPTTGQFDTMVANYENQVQAFGGAADVYVARGHDLSSGYSCPTIDQATGCVLFYDGDYTTASQSTTFSGGWTVVFNGSFSQTGGSQLLFVGGSNTVMVNGNALIEGVGISNAYLEVKGGTTFGGAATITGAAITLGNFDFDGERSSGAFQFDSSVVPPSATITGKVKVITYAEY